MLFSVCYFSVYVQDFHNFSYIDYTEDIFFILVCLLADFWDRLLVFQ